MNNGYYQATGAMVTQFNRLDVITQNLANINTIGYKRQDVAIADFERIFKEQRDNLPLEDNTKDAAKFIARSIDRIPHINDVYTDFSAGGMKSSYNPFDVAIVKDDIFFLVQAPDGEIKLSKNGAFTLDEQGFLSTKEGYRILNSNYKEQEINQRGINIPQNATLTITSNGEVYADNDIIDRLFLAKPREMKNLKQDGENLYSYFDIDNLQDEQNAKSLAQGFVQMSNVNPVTEMVNLIETQRLVETYQKVMTTHMTDLNNEAITKLASTRV